MTELKEKDFLRTFILELILVQKDSVFDLWDEEWITVPNNYLEILDEITSDEVKKEQYSDIIPKEEKDSWKVKVEEAYNDFLNSNGVTSKDIDGGKRIDLNREAISGILFDKSIELNTRVKIGRLAEDFLVTKEKAKPKEKRLV